MAAIVILPKCFFPTKMGCEISQDRTTATVILRNFAACICMRNFVLRIFAVAKFFGFANTSPVVEIKHKPVTIS